MTLPTLSPKQLLSVREADARLSDYDSTGAEAVRSLLGGIAAQLGIDDTPAPVA